MRPHPPRWPCWPAFPGDDGRRYVLRLASAPESLVVDQPGVVQAAFADAETGAPLPDHVTLVGGIPDWVEASLYGGRGVTVQRLDRVGHGVYEGRVRLWSTGPWRVMATLGPPASGTYVAGVLQVASR